jgi:hypothetical protein
LQVKLEEEALRYKLRSSNTELLESRAKLNIRGALEWIRNDFWRQKSQSGAAIKLPPKADNGVTIDNSLQAILCSEPFNEQFHTAAKKAKLRIKDAIQCFGNLYHLSSKDYHGMEGQLVIRGKHWGKNDRFCLAALFTAFDLKFTTLDDVGNPITFDLGAIKSFRLK